MSPGISPRSNPGEKAQVELIHTGTGVCRRTDTGRGGWPHEVRVDGDNHIHFSSDDLRAQMYAKFTKPTPPDPHPAFHGCVLTVTRGPFLTPPVLDDWCLSQKTTVQHLNLLSTQLSILFVCSAHAAHSYSAYPSHSSPRLEFPSAGRGSGQIGSDVVVLTGKYRRSWYDVIQKCQRINNPHIL